MINKFLIKLVTFIISIFDYSNKVKIKKFFYKYLKNKSINVIDIGAHKGETINFFIKNFNINKIFSFEPNIDLYKVLIQKNFANKSIEIFNYGVGINDSMGHLNIMSETSSSTFHDLNMDSKYFKKKKKYLSFFDKSSSLVEKKQEIKIINLSNFLFEKNITNIDILKIDTEGYELNVLKGISNEYFSKIKFILFEHHYDLMIKKKYKFYDINKILVDQNFKQKLKLKMKFRKSFEYIYENQKILTE